MIWLVRLVLFFLLFLVVRSVLNRILGRPPARRVPHASPKRDEIRAVDSETVKDPYCGTYVDKGLALALGSGSSALYFCSEECRRRYEAEKSRARS